MRPSTRACGPLRRRRASRSSARWCRPCHPSNSQASSRRRRQNGPTSRRTPASRSTESDDKKERRMARIVFGAGTSHRPMLLASDETLPRFQETDKNIKHRDKEGRPVTYGDLLEKADPKLADMVAPKNLVARQNVAREAAKHLRQAVAAAKLDALIVM